MQTNASDNQHNLNLTIKIIVGMLLGITVGCILHYLPQSQLLNSILVDGIFSIGGSIFFTVMKMLVVPIVLISLICGVCSLKDLRKLGRLGLKTILLYLFTTTLAICLGLGIASLFNIGKSANIATTQTVNLKSPPNIKEILINIFPSNPFAALAEGNMLQVISLAILFGIAIAALGKRGQRINDLFNDLNAVVMILITMLIQVAPYGIFCILAATFAKHGLALADDLLSYFFTTLLVLIIHMLFSNSLLLHFLAKLNPLTFFKKMNSAIIFAFSTSSSNVSIPVTLETVEHKLKVEKSIAAFIIPLGATINMDGTAIMQGVATVFIAHAYNIDITWLGYATVVLMAVLASIGTAGVPGVGLITLAMVLQQLGLPIDAIGLIIGIDRILDMARTAVNVTGDAAVACVVAKSEF